MQTEGVTGGEGVGIELGGAALRLSGVVGGVSGEGEIVGSFPSDSGLGAVISIISTRIS